MLDERVQKRAKQQANKYRKPDLEFELPNVLYAKLAGMEHFIPELAPPTYEALRRFAIRCMDNGLIDEFRKQNNWRKRCEFSSENEGIFEKLAATAFSVRRRFVLFPSQQKELVALVRDVVAGNKPMDELFVYLGLPADFRLQRGQATRVWNVLRELAAEGEEEAKE